MNERFNVIRTARCIGGWILAAALAGCSLFNGPWNKPEEPPAPAAAPVVEVPKNPPMATHKFQFDPAKDDVVGYVQTTTATADDTLPDIARRFDLGYEEVVRANPGVDPWLPGAGRTVVLPTQYILPESPREGLVINVGAMRMYYFPPREPGELQTVYTHPVGIGKIGWNTPEGSTRIIAKEKDPVWRVPDSVRKEHLENGEELPAVVPPGPDNPLGNRKFTLAWPTYLIHGTNKAYGVGMRSSHGCMRLYPEDVEPLFDMVPIGTKVTVVNQPFLFGWHETAMYFQAYGVSQDDTKSWSQAEKKLLSRTMDARQRKRLKEHSSEVRWDVVNAMGHDPRAVAVPVTTPEASVDSVLAAAKKVDNLLPVGSNWSGKDELLVSEQQFEQMLSDREPGSEAAPATPAAPTTPPAVSNQ
ncbi:MAG TPA: L,D-transpeptidase family protein [Steroidobacteraceae bacterium]|nr:L,D-transpeptidase family protein [Steroidobacteraceae bacterium]